MATWTHSIHPTPERELELERLGNQIAELAAHLDAATARLLALIREFDGRGGLGQWLSLLRRVADLAYRPRPRRRA